MAATSLNMMSRRMWPQSVRQEGARLCWASGDEEAESEVDRWEQVVSGRGYETCSRILNIFECVEYF